VAPETDAMEALSKMSRTGSSRMMVVDGEHLVGILALKDLLKFFSLKMELEDAG
jgi:CBS domain-containing protein